MGDAPEESSKLRHRRAQARARLEGLAERVEARAGWGDLVLPDAQLANLREIPAHVRRRSSVRGWTAGGRGAREGAVVLFVGPSGTGKTLAAQVIAADLQLDLFRIDLGQVVSKYVGETEKRLGGVLDAAEEAGAVLLLDEADALFGTGGAVRGGPDRHANLEASHVLQRLEAHGGLAILTSNSPTGIDDAFLRRFWSVVHFPPPSEAGRRELWRRAFAREVANGALDLDRLAQLDVAGGTIRCIALRAALLAADAGAPVGMTHVLRAARAEYAKLGRPLTAAELRNWPVEP